MRTPGVLRSFDRGQFRSARVGLISRLSSCEDDCIWPMAVTRQVRRLADLVDRIQVPANGGFWPGAPYSRPAVSSILTTRLPGWLGPCLLRSGLRLAPRSQKIHRESRHDWWRKWELRCRCYGHYTNICRSTQRGRLIHSLAVFFRYAFGELPVCRLNQRENTLGLLNPSSSATSAMLPVEVDSS